MSLLIVGGLFIFAVLAILGAVALTMTDRAAPQVATEAAAPAARPTIQLETPTPASRPTTQLETQHTVSRPLSQTLQATPGHHVSQPLPDETIQFNQYDALNGQIHELTSQLHLLYQQTQELSQRLNSLTQMADRIQHTPNGYATAEHSAYTLSDTGETTR